jgi:hypothetical protein
LSQAVEDGIITQEQADAIPSVAEMQSRRDLAGSLDRDALLAGALGTTLDELEAAYADGETMSSLMAEKGLDAAAVRDGLMAAHKAALAEAVADGVITQEQADRMSADQMGSSNIWGSRMPSKMGGRGGFEMPMDRDKFEHPEGFDGFRMDRGRGGFGGRGLALPGTDDTLDSGFFRPGRATLQGDSDL